MKKRLLNLGCGNVGHPNWVNADMVRFNKDVVVIDVRKKLPFKDNYFDAIYNSHLLEHLDTDTAKIFLQECYRILKKDGVIRIVVPDLEQIAKIYLEKLNEVSSGTKRSEQDYDWMILELFDQTTRTKTGGEMLKFMLDPNLRNKDFILSRVGQEVEEIWKKESIPKWERYSNVIKERGLLWLLKYLYNNFLSLIVLVLGGKTLFSAYREGLFRISGEVHKFMYDKYSLGRLLKKVGFKEARKINASESGIKGFYRYNLDAVKGKIRKPDSLFMEAVK